MTISEEIAHAATFFFGLVFVLCRLINKNVLEWFLFLILLLMCKEHTYGEADTLGSDCLEHFF